MADRLTRIGLKHDDQPWRACGLMVYGERTFEQMLKDVREHYQGQLEDARAVLNAKDDDFVVDLVEGSVVQRLIRRIEPKGDDD